ncbi:MAG: tRNA guanosine(34) transglycosylase Tgt [bacterium]|nr:tRNA guanosine(34) transglycosylase Tgt [bacterium]MDZ4299651.1 tRNA guanosine(34) transglycosylase Tgt [Candidatus Sungbacteria bacterium]
MFTITARDEKTQARTGILETPHGTVETPAFVAVGTHARVRTLATPDLVAAKTQLIIANTYHLWRTLGDEGLKTYQGLHAAMQWPYSLMTDSGGFQVFSLGIAREQGVGKVAGGAHTELSRMPEKNLVRITEDGVHFFEDDHECYLDAETSIRIQQQLGADIILAFDEPTSPLHDIAYTRCAMERTHRWEARSLAARSSTQLLYGIVQGGPFEELRRESAHAIAGMPFDGFAVGGAFGNSFGSARIHMKKELSWVSPFLPENKPRHLLGIGLVEDLFDGVAAGMDTFDCVVPTREARHGSIWTRAGRLDIKRGRYVNDTSIVDPECGCPVCTLQRTTKAELYALFHEKNEEAGRRASLHNLFFFNNLMEEIRRAVREKKLDELKARYLSRSAASSFS